ncbi:dephospho-CoA kinase [Clostridium sediminicola]|uniref:dephospho-CoA kinase n=1 Tax=Clostridium sediminicola TaxID=3114879 RepID=UPI0031F26FF4
MIKVGLTGGIGSGKSTVSNLIREKNIPIIDADIIARNVLDKYPEILINLKKEFGEIFFDDKGKLLRKEFGDFIFEKNQRRKKLEEIMIPYIIKEINLRMNEYDRIKEKIVLIDAPTLIEHGLHKIMDINVLVWVDKDTQIRRVMIRDSLSRNNTINRINAQMCLDLKKEIVDYVVNNTGSIEDSEKQVDKIFKEIMKDL